MGGPGWGLRVGLGFLVMEGGLACGLGDAHSGVGSPIRVFDPVAVAPPRVF